MDALIAIMGYLSTIPSGWQLIIGVLVGAILLMNLLDYERYKWKRINKTERNTMSFVESVLSTILSDSVANMRGIMLDIRNGELTQEDKIELNLCRFAAANSLLIETKHKIKSIICENGYYKKIKGGEDISQLSNQRAKELREISRSNIDSIIRSSSPLQGVSDKRFSLENSEKLFRLIIDKHISEIDSETSDIRSYGETKLGILYKLIKYNHSEE